MSYSLDIFFLRFVLVVIILIREVMLCVLLAVLDAVFAKILREESLNLDLIEDIACENIFAALIAEANRLLFVIRAVCSAGVMLT
jgi:hypothetical protein